MYIKSDYKDEYLRYIRSVDFSANTVRNLQSDMNSLHVWLSALNFKMTVETIYHEYQRYLIINETPHHTMNRKLSSLNKYILWLKSEHPISPTLSPDKSSSANHKALYTNRDIGNLHTNMSGYLKYFFGLLVLLSLIISIVLILRIIYPPTATMKTGFADTSTSNIDYALQFELQFSSPLSLSSNSNSKILFSFFPQNDPTHSIGYVECPFKDSGILGGSSRLKVTLDTHCGPLPSQVHDIIARNEAILTDIFLNGKKLTSAKVLLSNQKMVNRDLIDQEDMRDVLSKASKTVSLLPDGIISGEVLGFEVTSPSATLKESIPLAVFQNVSALDDGDIVTIYNNEIIRALLSTEVLGVKSADSIITQGVTYVHVVDSSASPINVGDYISTSTTPGYGQKATSRYDSIVGVALEPYIPGNSFLKVLMTTN